ncbi:MAG TPA: hypothetical protein VH720_01290 [Candidatus Limnocylindrales bacterium]|jgi:hypothetical protein
MLDPTAEQSFATYWRESTAGLVELTGDAFGWFAIESAELVAAIQTPDRHRNAQALCDVAVQNGINVGGFVGVVFMVGGRAIGAGAASVRVDGRVIPCAFLDDRGEHSFIAHEIGHVIGMDHSFRLGWVNPNGPLFGEYGAPHDIMSALTFGGFPVTRAVPIEADSGINVSAKLWNMGGPGVAMATLWRYLPGFPAEQPWVEMLPAGAGPTKLTLNRPGVDGLRLAVMPTRAGDGWWTVEYRPAIDWDIDLHFNSSDVSNAPGLIIHRLRDVGTAAAGPAFPLIKRVSYEATLPLPSGGDLDWTNGQFAVRVLENLGGSVRVMVGETLPDAAAARMDILAGGGLETSIPNPQQVDLALAGPTCSRARVGTQAIVNPYNVLVTVASTGFTRPRFDFKLNGNTFGVTSELGEPPQIGAAVIQADIIEPTGFNTVQSVTRPINLQWAIDGHLFQVQLPPGDGTYRVTLEVTVTEGAAGAPPRQASATDAVSVETKRIILSDEGNDAEQQCLSFLIAKGLQEQPPFPPDPIGPIAFPPDWQALDGVELATGLKTLFKLNVHNSTLAAGPIDQAAAQLGVLPQTLFHVVKMLVPVDGP